MPNKVWLYTGAEVHCADYMLGFSFSPPPSRICLPSPPRALCSPFLAALAEGPCWQRSAAGFPLSDRRVAFCILRRARGLRRKATDSPGTDLVESHRQERFTNPRLVGIATKRPPAQICRTQTPQGSRLRGLFLQQSNSLTESESRG